MGLRGGGACGRVAVPPFAFHPLKGGTYSSVCECGLSDTYDAPSVAHQQPGFYDVPSVAHQQPGFFDAPSVAHQATGADTTARG